MYTVLDTALNVVGFLSNKGRGANDFWGDTISQQIADTQDILGNVDLTVDNVSRNIDVSGNTKNWNHTLSGISFNNTPVGAQVENGYYLLYKDDATNRHYLMQLTSVSEKVTPGGQHYKTATGVNAALYDFSRMIVDAKEFYSAPTGTQTLGSLQNILKYLLGHAGWNVNVEDYNFPDVQYSISDNTSVQSVLQDIIKLFDVDVDAYVTLTPQGRLAKRVVEFRRTMGTDSGVTIRYGKNMTDMTREALSDSIYTKLYVQGSNSLKISSVNNGLPYIVDEAANKRYNPVGASSSPETFREGTVINSMITDARSLLSWGKKQMAALNHPRINYTISSIASTEAGLGDTIRVQDLYASQEILLTSRVIQKTISFANPTINTLVLGEYSSVLGDKTKNVDLIARLDQVSKDVTVVSEAAVNNKVIAEAASNAATQAKNAAAKNSAAVAKNSASLDVISKAMSQANSDIARIDGKNAADTTSLNALITKGLSSAASERSNLSAATTKMFATADSNAKSMADSAYAGAMSGVTNVGNLIAGLSGTVSEMNVTMNANKTAIAKAGSDLSTGVANAKSYADTVVGLVSGSASAALSSVTADVTGVKAEFDTVNKTANSLLVTTNSLAVNASGVNGKLTAVTSTASGAMSAAASVAANVSGINASFNQVTSGINNKLNGIGQINQLFNTEFSPDMAGWTQTGGALWHPSITYPTYNGSPVLGISDGSDNSSSYKMVTSDKYPIQGGIPLTVSLYAAMSPAATSTSTANYFNFSVDFFDANGKGTSVTYSSLSTKADWNRYSFKTTAPSGTVSYHFNFYLRGQGATYVAKPMVSFSNVLGDYVPGAYNNNKALEDATASYSAGISGLAASMAVTKSDVAGLTTTTNSLAVTASGLTAGLATTNSTISQTNSATASLKADVSGLHTTYTALSSSVAGSLTSQHAEYSAGIDGLKTQIATVDNNAKSNATVAQNTAITTASQNATTLVNTATTSLSNGIAKTYATQTQLTQTASQFNVTATSLQNQVNNLNQVNQLANTEFNPDAAGWYLQGKELTGVSGSDWYITVASRSGVGGANGITIYNSASETGSKFIRSEKILLAGQNLPLSYSLRIAQNAIGENGRIAVEIEYFNSKDQQIDFQGYRSFTTTQDWNTLTVNNLTASVPTDLQYARLAIYVVGAGTKVYFGKPIVVFGTSVGGYVLGSYNNNSRVAALEVSADAIEATVQDQAKSLSATATVAANGVTIATQASNAAANVAITASGISQTVASNDAKTTATFATLADQITTEVANRKTGDSDTQTQLANLNSTVVKNSTGIATLTQTASAIQATVATKTDKSTVLQLFSDNFEAGIKANTGALIAGINADTSGTTIAGKHITLDGSVTVTGAFVSKALSTADATITKVLTIGSGGSIVNTYTKSGTFTGYSGQVSYSLSGKFTFNNSGISFGGTAKGPNAPTSTSGEVSQRGIPFVPTQWNASSVVNEALMQMSATEVKGYSVKSDVLASGDSSYLNLSAFNIQLNSGGYDTYIGPDMIMTDGQVQASAFTARGTSYFKNIEAGVVDSGPIRLNNAHTIFTTDGTTLYLAGGAQGGGAGVQVTDNFTVKGDMSVGTVNAGGNINVGWDVIKNGTGLHPDYFNNTLPGIHIMGTNSGIAWDIKNKLAYIIIENSYKGLGNNNTGTGKWKN